MRIAVQGQATIRGEYTPSGNSNAAIGVIAASLLSDEKTTIHRLPDTLSTGQMLHIAEQLGTTITREGDSPSTVQLETSYIQSRLLDQRTTDQFPAGVLYLAPIITRRHHARLEWSTSLRRLRTHLVALQDLGFKLDIDGNAVNITAERWDTRELVLTWQSVTATALVCMLAATLGQKTTIYNAASEPHLRILQHQLIQMGAKIEGVGSNLLTIYGIGGTAKGSNVYLPYDHIEIASMAAISAITPGQVSIKQVYLPDLRMILKVFERLGLQYYLEAVDGVAEEYILHIPDQNGMQAAHQVLEEPDIAIDTAPWPGFPSDLVALTTVLATQVRGTTLIHERLFDNRLLFTDKLKAMGAQILLCDPHRAVVIGNSILRAEYIDSPDVRVGLALLGAALCAEGESIIDRAELIDHTFENVIQKLTGIGAQIEVVAYD
jgi:UDP-N-acetylglucosamine 1-carboxyvinyltransferase